MSITEIGKQIQACFDSKARNQLIIEAKQNMLMVALMNKAKPEEVEKARQELLDAMTASVDEAIASFQKSSDLIESLRRK